MEFDVDDHRINLTIVAMRAPFGPGILCPPVSYDLPPGGVVHRQTFRYYPKRMNLVMAHAEVFIDFDDDPDSEGEVFPWPNPPPTPDQVAGELLPPGIHEMVMDMPPRPGVPPLPNMMTREERDRHFAEVHRRAVDGFRTWRRR
ncbi:Secreted protein [Plasmodiophora brassicae]